MGPFATDICICSHGIERHTPADDYGPIDFCHGRPLAGHTFGDRLIGKEGPCKCRRFSSIPGPTAKKVRVRKP